MRYLSIALIVTCILSGCCSNSLCRIDKAIATLDTVFVTQWNEGVAKSGENFASIGEYIVDDVETCPERLGNTIGSVYNNVNFANAGERFGYYGREFKKEWNVSLHNTSENLKAIAQWMCLYGDEK